MLSHSLTFVPFEVLHVGGSGGVLSHSSWFPVPPEHPVTCGMNINGFYMVDVALYQVYTEAFPAHCSRLNRAFPQKRHVLPEPMNVIGFGQRVFTDITHLRISRCDLLDFSLGPK